MGATDSDFRGSSGFSAESWEMAGAFADSLGRLPASVTSLIRFLLQDYDANPLRLSRDSREMLARFLKSRVVQAPYFHAIGFFKPERLVPLDRVFRVDDIIDSFSAPEHALFLGLLFFHRLALRLSDRVLIEQVTPRLQVAANSGWLAGNALKTVGAFSGFVVAAYRWIGVLPLVRHDPQGFALYMRHLRKTDAFRPDGEFEHARWGCSSSQIGLLLLQRFGFGTARLVPLMRATTTIATLIGLADQERNFRVAEVWVRYLLEKRSAPSIPLPPAYYLGPRDIDLITGRLTDAMYKKHSAWLSADRDSISMSETPQLFTPEFMQSIKVKPTQDDGGIDPADDAEVDAITGGD